MSQVPSKKLLELLRAEFLRQKSKNKNKTLMIEACYIMKERRTGGGGQGEDEESEGGKRSRNLAMAMGIRLHRIGGYRKVEVEWEQEAPRS